MCQNLGKEGMADQFDYIVVGAGSSGCVLANRLSADGRHNVLLLEAGPKDNYLWIHIPIGYGKTMFHKAYNWGFYTDPEANMKDRKIYWPRGRGLGGSSSINGLIFVRGQREDYDHWAQLGNAGWDWDSVLPYFIKSEHNSRGASKTHGGDGPLWSSDIVEKNELMEAINHAATAAATTVTQAATADGLDILPVPGFLQDHYQNNQATIVGDAEAADEPGLTDH